MVEYGKPSGQYDAAEYVMPSFRRIRQEMCCVTDVMMVTGRKQSPVLESHG